MASQTRPITIAIAALGGQGGGVLTNWIVDLAEQGGYLAQSTSVPGVAQRTGATIYCVEIFPKAAAEAAGREPVLALMAVPGDVDIVIAAELLEAGRAIQRGFVTAETTLIASSHRMYSMVEKTAMGDGILDKRKVIDTAEKTAKRFVCFDMHAAAEETGSVISSVLLGALAGSGALPFPREAFEQAIHRSGIAIQTNLAGFARGFDGAASESAPSADAPSSAPRNIMPGDAKSSAANRLLGRVVGTFPDSCQPLIIEGVKRLVDYQDPRYADRYLDRLESLLELDRIHGGEAGGYTFTTAAARYLALWMSYEDIIRVADLKTRASRFERFRSEVRAQPDQLVYVSEFMHPRIEEICDTMPAPLGRYFLGSRSWRRFLGLFCRGRQVNTTKISGFLLLYTLAGLRRWRRMTLRFKTEEARIEQWLQRASGALKGSYALGVEILECQRLIKGYSDTHERGVKNFERIMSAIDELPPTDETGRTVRALREAALADEHGSTLTETLKKVA